MSSFASGVRLGARMGTARLLGRPLAFLALLALSTSAVVAVSERDRELLAAPSRALGVVLAWILPLVCFAIVSLALGRARLDECAWPIAKYGIARRVVSLGLIASSMTAAVLVGVASVLVTLALSYARMPGLWSDLVTSSWIAALGACAYVALFMLGAGFFRLGRGRWAALAFDFLIAGGTGAVAAAGPRAHLRSLVGGAPVLELSQPQSSVWLLAMTIGFAILAAMRAGD